MIGDCDKLWKYIENTITKLVEDDISFLIICFALKKKTLLLCIGNRSGIKYLDGKYTINGKVNKTWKFTQNDNPKYEIARIYYDSDQDEAVWVIRSEKDDKENNNISLIDNNNNNNNNNDIKEEERWKKEKDCWWSLVISNI